MQRDTTWRPLGIGCILLGAAAMGIATAYPYGTVTAMGPGFVPTAVALLLVLFGGLILAGRGGDVPAAAEAEAGPPAFSAEGPWRVIGAITAAIVLFGLAIRPLGLPLTVFGVVMVAGLAHPEARPGPLVLLALLLAAAAALVFVGFLGLSIGLAPRLEG